MVQRIKETASRADGTDRPVQTAMVFAPKVLSVDGPYLVCDANQSPSKPPDSGILDGFLNLADAPDEVLKFARKWGALKVQTKAIPGLRFLEPIAAWQALALRFRALRRIGADLNQERIGAVEEWKVLGVEPQAGKKALDDARLLLMSSVRRLVDEAKLRPRLYWNKLSAQWQIDFDASSGSNLLAILVLQLMLAIADKDGYAKCSNCPRTYMPERRPSIGRRNYCPECRKAGVPFRDSKREQRRKKKEEYGQTKTRKR